MLNMCRSCAVKLVSPQCRSSREWQRLSPMFLDWQWPLHTIAENTRRTVSQSALFVPGKLGNKQYKIVSPEFDADDIKKRRDILEKMIQRKKLDLNLNMMEQDITNYLEIKKRVDILNQKQKTIRAQMSERSASSPAQLSALKSSLNQLISENKLAKAELATAEEAKSLLDYLRLPNCDQSTPLESRVVYDTGGNDNFTDASLLRHTELIEKFELAELSGNSDTAVYLHSRLARLELRLIHYFQNVLLDEGYDQFANPDFTKSVIAEGCGEDINNATSNLFHLSPFQDFGDRESMNAMYLVGGASNHSFVAYFVRHILHNPDAVLPLRLFAIGRQYRPSPSSATETTIGGLANCQQSNCVQVFSLASCRHDMEQQFEQGKQLMTKLFQGFGCLRVVDLGIDDLEKSQARCYSFQLYLKGSNTFIQVGTLYAENDYYSRRMMMKFEDSSTGQRRNFWTVGGTLVNITRLLAVIIENNQTSCSGGVDLDIKLPPN